MQKQIIEENLEHSDMQEDFLYSLMQIKKGSGSDKDYERIGTFIKFITGKIVENSQYADELDEDFICKTISKAVEVKYRGATRLG